MNTGRSNQDLLLVLLLCSCYLLLPHGGGTEEPACCCYELTTCYFPMEEGRKSPPVAVMDLLLVTSLWRWDGGAYLYVESGGPVKGLRHS